MDYTTMQARHWLRQAARTLGLHFRGWNGEDGCLTETNEVARVLEPLGYSAPLSVVFALLSRESYDEPEDIVLAAISDPGGDFAFYRVAGLRESA